jgi:hypothetical protein
MGLFRQHATRVWSWFCRGRLINFKGGALNCTPHHPHYLRSYVNDCQSVTTPSDFCESCFHVMFFRAFSSVVRQMPGYNSQRRGTACTSQFSFLCILCTVFVYMCAVLLPPGVNPVAVKYIYIYISYLIKCAGVEVLLS